MNLRNIEYSVWENIEIDVWERLIVQYPHITTIRDVEQLIYETVYTSTQDNFETVWENIYAKDFGNFGIS